MDVIDAEFWGKSATEFARVGFWRQLAAYRPLEKSKGLS